MIGAVVGLVCVLAVVVVLFVCPRVISDDLEREEQGRWASLAEQREWGR